MPADIKLKTRLGEATALDSERPRGHTRPARRRFQGAAALILLLALILASLAFSASAQAAGDTAKAWGYNGNGELGNGMPGVNSSTPVDVSGLSGATAISAGGSHSLALLSNGTVMAWGGNADGQLGDGTVTEKDTPVPVNGLSGVVAISAGDSHSLALLSNGTVMAWGQNTDGQLGNGNNTGPDTCGADPCSKVPIPVSGLSGVVAITAGGFHNLALLSNGTVVAWGQNTNGELGNGMPGVNSSTPVGVSGLSGVSAIAASLVDGHNLALLSDGTVMAWGRNVNGELGDGTTMERDTPVPVSGLSGVVAISAGDRHSLALLASGTAMAWGGNVFGELGNGTTNTSGCQCVPSPMPVSGLPSATAIAAADAGSLVLLSNGTAMAWGYNANGQLGNGSNTGPDSCGPDPCGKTPAAVSGLSGATAISSFFHSLALVGPSQVLSVSLAGAGTGAVGGAGILCPPSCSQRYPQAATLALLAHPAAGTAFAGFSGACTGTGPCRVTMSQDQSVTATFGPPKGTKITKAKLNRRKRSASFSFSAPGAITGFQCALLRPNRGHHKKPHFSACGSPKRYKHLRAGPYVFEVRALDVLGADATPARKKFKV